MFMPEGKMRLFAQKFKFSPSAPEKKCLIQSHGLEPMFHFEAISSKVVVTACSAR
jgi:hypothetical protein